MTCQAPCRVGNAPSSSAFNSASASATVPRIGLGWRSLQLPSETSSSLRSRHRHESGEVCSRPASATLRSMVLRRSRQVPHPDWHATVTEISLSQVACPATAEAGHPWCTAGRCPCLLPAVIGACIRRRRLGPVSAANRPGPSDPGGMPTYVSSSGKPNAVQGWCG